MIITYGRQNIFIVQATGLALQGLAGTNTLAYLAAALVTKKEFSKTDTW
jgi:hypothetical protein